MPRAPSAEVSAPEPEQVRKDEIVSERSVSSDMIPPRHSPSDIVHNGLIGAAAPKEKVDAHPMPEVDINDNVSETEL